MQKETERGGCKFLFICAYPTCKLSSGKDVSGIVEEKPSMSTKSLSVDP